MSDISGLTVCPDFLTTIEHDDLLRAIDAQPWSDALRRRTQHYGWRYSYDRRRLDATRDYLGAMPTFLRALAARVAPAFDDRLPDQAIVNEYLPEQGISAHVDHVQNFGPVVVSISLGAPATMLFARTGRTIPIELLPRSLCVITDDARFRWTHAIPRHEQRRVSITFRTVRTPA